MSERFSLKDHLFNKKTVGYLADLFYAQDENFPRDSFVENIIDDFPELELKQRIVRITNELYRVLPKSYPDALQKISAALPSELDPEKTDDDFGDFILAPLSHYIAMHGCYPEYLEISLFALRECTKRFSSEDAIRYFINAFPNETYNFLRQCAVSDNYHVRRLSSEGLRPSLPWCQKISIDYKKPIEILDMLFVDRTRYVTRSVANHMNDISKKDPDLVIETLRAWQQSGRQAISEINFIMRHSLRTLVKQGNPEALELLGYPREPKIQIENFTLHTPEVAIDDALEFSFDIVSSENQNLMIDYVIHYVGSRGSTSPRVFKIKKGSFEQGETIHIHKKQLFRIMTTKKLYPGIHRVQIQINGVVAHEFSFNLAK